jgi:hypothetical protein
MTTSKFSFLNIHTSKPVFYLAIILPVSVFISLISGIYWWFLFFPVLIIFFVILTLNKSSVTIIRNEKSKTILIKTLQFSHTLQEPLTWSSFWTYDWNGRPRIFPVAKGKQSKSNDILVHLHIIDKTGKEILFVEKNVFGTNFPNHTKYENDEFKAEMPILKVQSVEKLISFFKIHLSDTEFHSSIKVPEKFRTDTPE